MKKLIKKIVGAARTKIMLLLLALLLAFSLQPSAFGQVGTYVTPRISTVFNQWVTNQGTYTFYATNYLCMSGWHNVNWQISEWGTNNMGTNFLPINIYGSSGSGNNYTNAAAGTNFVYTSSGLIAPWPGAIGGTGAAGLASNTNTLFGIWTNMTQNVADGFQVFKGTFTVGATNSATIAGFNLQIDEVITP